MFYKRVALAIGNASSPQAAMLVSLTLRRASSDWILVMRRRKSEAMRAIEERQREYEREQKRQQQIRSRGGYSYYNTPCDACAGRISHTQGNGRCGICGGGGTIRQGHVVSYCGPCNGEGTCATCEGTGKQPPTVL